MISNAPFLTKKPVLIMFRLANGSAFVVPLCETSIATMDPGEPEEPEELEEPVGPQTDAIVPT